MILVSFFEKWSELEEKSSIQKKGTHGAERKKKKNRREGWGREVLFTRVDSFLVQAMRKHT